MQNNCIFPDCREERDNKISPCCYCTAHGTQFCEKWGQDFVAPCDMRYGDVLIPVKENNFDCIIYNLFNHDFALWLDGGVYGLTLTDEVRERLAWALLGAFKGRQNEAKTGPGAVLE